MRRGIIPSITAAEEMPVDRLALLVRLERDELAAELAAAQAALADQTARRGRPV